MSDAFETMRHMNSDNNKKFCKNCGYEFKEGEIECPKCKNNKNINEINKGNEIKDFIIRIGRILVDFDTIIWFIIAVIICLLCCFYFFNTLMPSDNGLYDNVPYAPIIAILALVLPIIIIIWVVITRYIIYLLIDIRDSLKQISSQKDN